MSAPMLMTPEFIITTSWDDGHVLDLRVAALLERHQLPGTFYVSPADREITASGRLTPDQIRGLAQHFEIGAHTLTHPRLPQLPDMAAAAAEISGSKTALEQIIGRPVTSFCYPGGAYAPEHVDLVRKAGYKYARTVRRYHATVAGRPLEAGTTIHAYRHWSDLWPILRTARFNPVTAVRYLRHWDLLAIALFDRTARTGGIFHLWGHSWEIEANQDWERLERVLVHMSGHKSARYSTNGGLAS